MAVSRWSGAGQQACQRLVVVQAADGIGQQRRNGLHLKRERGGTALRQGVGGDHAPYRQPPEAPGRPPTRSPWVAATTMPDVPP